MRALKQYLPALSLVLATVLSALAAAWTDDRVTTPELLSLAVTALTAFSVYVVPRAVEAPWLKPAVAAVLAGVNAFQAFLTDGVSKAEWVLVALAILGALGVVVTNGQVPVTEPVAAGSRAGEVVEGDI
jgi:hypothetical protein